MHALHSGRVFHYMSAAEESKAPMKRKHKFLMPFGFPSPSLAASEAVALTNGIFERWLNGDWGRSITLHVPLSFLCCTSLLSHEFASDRARMQDEFSFCFFLEKNSQRPRTQANWVMKRETRKSLPQSGRLLNLPWGPEVDDITIASPFFIGRVFPSLLLQYRAERPKSEKRIARVDRDIIESLRSVCLAQPICHRLRDCKWNRNKQATTRGIVSARRDNLSRAHSRPLTISSLIRPPPACFSLSSLDSVDNLHEPKGE